MNNTREIKNHINQVENIFKITRAMQVIAASRMRQAKNKTIYARPFVGRSLEVLSYLSLKKFEKKKIPLFNERKVKNVAVIFISPSKGLCGSLIPNLVKQTIDYVSENKENGINLKFIIVGNKGEELIKKLGVEILAVFKDKDKWHADDAQMISELMLDLFNKGSIDRATVIYTNFISVLNQKAESRDFLPLSEKNLEKLLGTKNPDLFKGKTEAPIFKIEPNPKIIAKELVPYLIRTGIYYLLWESKASEHASRMIAMQNARKNSEELQADLELTFNQARQSAITTQVIEITSGAAALEEE